MMRIKTHGWSRWIRALALLLFFLAQGCLPKPVIDERALNYPLPEQWQNLSLQGSAPVSSDWVTALRSSELNALIQEALTKNLGLQRTYIDLRMAQAVVDLIRAQGMPHVEANVDARRGTTSMSQEGRRIRQNQKHYRGLTAMSWEMDLWGRLADQNAAAEADLHAAQADMDAARFSLAAQVSKVWIEMIALNQMVQIARQAEQSHELGARKVRERFERGLATALDMRLALVDLAAAQESRLRQERELSATARRLQQLIGRYPDGRLTVGDVFPDLSMTIPTGLPAQILDRRPDIQAAYRRLVATDHRVAASCKAFLPQVRLTGDVGVGGSQLMHVSDGRHVLWNLASGIVQPLFQGGRLAASLDEAESKASAAWIDYAQVVERALGQVEQALDNEERSKQEMAALILAVKQAERARELALQYYAAGRVDVLHVLEAQRRTYAARTALTLTHSQRLQNRINLHLALGGDFIVALKPKDDTYAEER
ncbi:efflux transporter outer membrane subunit [Desulfonatronum sp. SC1]|uniref:efflux transporter outer membrane subunit n=1 Tax=Desulfonatronum sp. SC1 TaxID=2109626 RepID=UPI001304EDAB|nr:TolC family protein [Desulfonatronum sp. SC1]